MALGWRGQYVRYKEFFLNIVDLYKKRSDLRAFLEIVLSLATVVIFLLFALKPTVLTILSLTQEIKEKREVAAGLTKKVSDLETASSIYASNLQAVQDINTAVSTKASPESIVKQIQGIAAKNSVNLVGLSIGETVIIGEDLTNKNISEFPAIGSGAKEMPISASVTGSYESLLGFTRDFNNLRTVSNVDILGITSSQLEAGEVITLSVTARVPFL